MGMISIKELSVEAETSVLNENGEFSMAIPSFKKNFSRKTKEMWGMFDNDEKFTNKELVTKANELINLLATLKNDVSLYSIHTG
jgi:hypothetical protein